MSDKPKKGLLSGLKNQQKVTAEVQSSPEPVNIPVTLTEHKPAVPESRGVLLASDVVVVENDRGVWACYVDGRFTSYGGNEMSVRELIASLRGRAMRSLRVLDVGTWYPTDFPIDLKDVPGA